MKVINKEWSPKLSEVKIITIVYEMGKVANCVRKESEKSRQSLGLLQENREQTYCRALLDFRATNLDANQKEEKHRCKEKKRGKLERERERG